MISQVCKITSRIKYNHFWNTWLKNIEAIFLIGANKSYVKFNNNF